jgi:adenylate cyclase
LLLLALVPLRIVDLPPCRRSRRSGCGPSISTRRCSHARRCCGSVVVVDIDEASIKEIGQWLWPRTIVADPVTRLAELGVVAIGFDAIFAEPDRMSPSIAATSFRNLDDDIRDNLRPSEQ